MNILDYKKEYKEYRRSLFGIIYNLLIVVSFIIAILIAAGVFDFIYDIDEQYFKFTLNIFIVPLLLLIPRYFYFQEKIRSQYSIKFLKIIEFFAAYIYIINEAGTLYFFKRFSGFDSFAHTSVPIFFSLFFLLLYFSLNGFDKFSKKVFFTAILIFVSLGGIFEIYEKLNDIIFGTKMFYDPFQNIRADTISDLLFDVFGFVLGVSFFFLSYNKIKSYFERRSQRTVISD